MNNLLVTALVMLLIVGLPAHGQDAGRSKVRIVLAGDSTVTDKVGWGLGFKKAMNDGVEVVNLARGGRSSKSFRDEGLWQQVLEAKPDYVLIQFGHNDQPGKGPERETDPKTTFRANLARYVDEARAAGAKPVLLTSLSRRRWDDKGIHIRSDLTDYVEATRAVAAEKKVPLIDLHARSIEVYESLGPKGCELISPRDKDGGADHTHLNVVGSELFGPIVAWDLKRALPALTPHIRGSIPAEKRAATSQPTTSRRPAPPQSDWPRRPRSRRAGALRRSPSPPTAAATSRPCRRRSPPSPTTTPTARRSASAPASTPARSSFRARSRT